MSKYYVADVPEEHNGEMFTVQKPVDSPQHASELYPGCPVYECDSETNLRTPYLWESRK